MTGKPSPKGVETRENAAGFVREAYPECEVCGEVVYEDVPWRLVGHSRLVLEEDCPYCTEENAPDPAEFRDDAR